MIRVSLKISLQYVLQVMVDSVLATVRATLKFWSKYKKKKTLFQIQIFRKLYTNKKVKVKFFFQKGTYY